ncbi:MAG: hypothetical protein LCH82_02350 [Actinobacteria bacterium]|nr:hypothetical protein [Actinomycetota bacterium]
MSDLTSMILRAQDEQRTAEDAARLSAPAMTAEDYDSAITGSATRQTHAVAAEAEEIADAFRVLDAELRAIRDEAKAGRLSRADAVDRLKVARSTYAILKRRHQQVSDLYRSAERALTNTSDVREEMLAKYPALRK